MYELHLKLFSKITLKKPQTFPKESRQADLVLTNQRYCHIHRTAQSHRIKKLTQMSNMWQTFNQLFLVRASTAKGSTRNVNISQSRTKPGLTAPGHLIAPANRSTAQAKQETPLKSKSINHLETSMNSNSLGC